MKLRCLLHRWHGYILKNYPPDKLSKLRTTDPCTSPHFSYHMSHDIMTPGCTKAGMRYPLDSDFFNLRKIDR